MNLSMILDELNTAVRRFHYLEDYELTKPSDDAIGEMLQQVKKLCELKEEEISAYRNMLYIVDDSSFNQVYDVSELLSQAHSVAQEQLQLLDQLRSIVAYIEEA